MIAILASLLLAFSVTHSEGTGNVRQEFDWIATAAQHETGLAQIREINLSVNSLLNTRLLLKPPDMDRWRGVDEILDSDYRDNCKDYVVLKVELLNRVGIPSQRVIVLVRASNELHVVLQVHLGDQDAILDNLRSVMVSMADLSAFYEIENGAP
jgi:predicted transglutaminase-like cysteine proteinase